jgi:hypothetical protein
MIRAACSIGIVCLGSKATSLTPDITKMDPEVSLHDLPVDVLALIRSYLPLVDFSQLIFINRGGLPLVKNVMNSVTSLDLYYSPGLRDVSLPVILGELLQNLDIGCNPITDQGLTNLAACTRLTRLLLSYCPITDAGLVNLLPLTNIRHLELSNTKITGAGVSQLCSLTQLRSIDLSFTPCGQMIRPLSVLTNLIGLNLRDTGLTCISLLGLFTKLQVLNLGSAPFPKTEYPHLVQLTCLEQLCLRQNFDFNYLSGLTNLCVFDTWIPFNGSADALLSLPKLRHVALNRHPYQWPPSAAKFLATCAVRPFPWPF